MRNAIRRSSFSVLLCLTLTSAHPTLAATCGDANRTGTVTVTDGVLILRSAAQLPTLCPRERCDMNVDGDISVTDGVLALRVAAEIETSVACSAAQVGTIFGQVAKISGLGGLASSAGRARAAGTTTPCSNGGFTEDDGTTLTFIDCAAGDFVTNGTLTFLAAGPDAVDVVFDTSDFVISTGETNDTFGFLTFSFGNRIQLSGVLTHLSTIVGVYTDEFLEVFLDDDFFTTSGRIITTITEGEGFFTNVFRITSTIYSPTLAQIFVEYASGGVDLFTFADGLCEPCTGGCANDSLACVSCVGQCSNSTGRCGIDFEALECGDGVFGPIGLCDPCTSNGDCNTAENLSCFPCAENCTGNTNRCGSSLAFVECGDGAY